MKKSTSRIVGLVMLIIAVAFIMFAVNHPEMSFPWNNTITWLLYGLYVLVTVVLLIAPKRHGKAHCDLKAIRKEPLERFVVDTAIKVIFSDEIIERLIDLVMEQES